MVTLLNVNEDFGFAQFFPRGADPDGAVSNSQQSKGYVSVTARVAERTRYEWRQRVLSAHLSRERGIDSLAAKHFLDVARSVSDHQKT